MRTNVLAFLNDYTHSSNKIQQVRVDSKEVKQFHKIYENFYRKLGHYSKELQDQLKVLKPLNFYLQISCLNYSELIDEKLDEVMEKKIVEFFNEIYNLDDPTLIHLVELYQKILNQFLENEVDNKIDKELNHLLRENEGERIAIVSFESLEKKYNIEKVDVYHPNKLLKRNELYDVVIFIGTPSLFPEYQTTFFGKEIYYISHDIYNINFKTESILNKSKNALSNLYEKVNLEADDFKLRDKPFMDDEAVNVEKEIRINYLVEKYTGKSESELNSNIPGYMIPFTKGRVYFVPEGARVHTLKISNDAVLGEDLQVQRETLKNLEKGDWIIIKKSTASKYLSEIAMKLIGRRNYENHYSYIKKYKDDLLEKLEEKGNLKNLFSDMRREGVNISDIMLLKNWVYGETIKPRVLTKILKYLNYSDEKIQQTLIAAEEIVRSHKKAGRESNKNLNEKIQMIDNEEIMEEMIQHEEYEFELEGVGEFLVQQIQYSPQKLEDIDVYHMYRLLEG
ncbi:hypothetical protein [Staphylococcus sp. EZ-P03]|uniref:DISARM anti-phage system protein DrmE domain-containing protein n=1 Tax=Staphylococcus sp. EZ-P03 TaxID=2282739 RepID=UPI000DF74646|nr:hypothetical protein [Staphylococcus sp. EZ-P03]